MKPVKKTKKTSSSTSSTKSKMTTREKMLARKKDLESRGSSSNMIYPKEGVTRVRLKSPGLDEEIGIEIIQFYFGQEIGGVISPATFDEPCPIMEKYKELKDSDDNNDKALAKRLVPKRKYVLGGIFYKDDKGKEIDTERVDKGLMVGRGVYQDIIELFLDEDEWGDMTDPKEGYDIKILRTGKGKNDTEYTVSPCQKKPLDSKYRGVIDLKKIVKGQIPDYEKLEDILAKFLKETPGEDDEETPRIKSKIGDKKKKKRRGDI